ncbi:MAG: hypothetical protein L0Y36_01050 [Planctomycetales bacterium]|nr:hypothetical protein [Planctomycetales bacterium]
MTPKQKQRDPFFMLFPWGKVTGLLFLLVFGAMIVYRLSETGGIDAHRACLAAMIAAGVCGGVGLYAIGKTWGRGVYWVLGGVMIASAIRLLIGGAGVAIITFFTEIHRSWFVLFLGIYYMAFVAADSWFALWVLRNSEWKTPDETKHGNLWDIVG